MKRFVKLIRISSEFPKQAFTDNAQGRMIGLSECELSNVMQYYEREPEQL